MLDGVWAVVVWVECGLCSVRILNITINRDHRPSTSGYVSDIYFRDGLPGGHLGSWGFNRQGDVWGEEKTNRHSLPCRGRVCAAVLIQATAYRATVVEGVHHCGVVVMVVNVLGVGGRFKNSPLAEQMKAAPSQDPTFTEGAKHIS
jgi:hypothetical protein